MIWLSAMSGRMSFVALIMTSEGRGIISVAWAYDGLGIVS